MQVRRKAVAQQENRAAPETLPELRKTVPANGGKRPENAGK